MKSNKLAASTSRRQWLKMSMGCAGLAVAPTSMSLAAAPPDVETMVWDQRILQGFGTTLWLRAGHARRTQLSAGLDAAVDSIRLVEAQMSLFDSGSAVSKLNRVGQIRNPDSHLVNILNIAQQVSDKTDGAFDVTVQPLWRVWEDARQSGGLPAAAKLSAARQLVNWRDVSVTPDLIAFGRAGMGITLNGIAQGYAADLARAALTRHGIGNALLDTGEWATLGASPSNGEWTLGIENPREADAILATLAADGRFIAASSDSKYMFTADRRHHHILNPQTGQSPLELASVVVAAPSGALADALTKVMFMGSAKQAMAQAARWNVDVLTVDKSGNWQASPGLNVKRA